MVSACHTVSSVVLDDLIEEFHLPILGVVEPGIKAALDATRNHRIGVIGTRATVVSGTYERKLREKREGVVVVSQACPLFVPLAEEGWIEGDVIRRVAEIYLKPLVEAGIDTLILGCTHYPLLKSVIQSIMGKEVVIVDSAEETAKLVAERLQKLHKEGTPEEGPAHRFYVSDIPHQFCEVGGRFLGMEMTSVEKVELETMDLTG